MLKCLKDFKITKYDCDVHKKKSEILYTYCRMNIQVKIGCVGGFLVKFIVFMKRVLHRWHVNMYFVDTY